MTVKMKYSFLMYSVLPSVFCQFYFFSISTGGGRRLRGPGPGGGDDSVSVLRIFAISISKSNVSNIQVTLQESVSNVTR